MKIKTYIANYGENQLWCLKKMLQEFATFDRYKIDIVIYTNTNIENFCCKLYNNDIGSNLPYMCREDMANDIENYDLFLYNENDHLITQKNIDAFVEFQKELSSNEIAGFIRYEIRDNQHILVDIVSESIEHQDDYKVSFQNKHQGCYLLTKNQLKHCIDSGQFLHQSGRGPYGPLEQGATDPYNKCNLNKVFPADSRIKNHLIWHMTNKYTKEQFWLDKGITVEQLLNLNE